MLDGFQQNNQNDVNWHVIMLLLPTLTMNLSAGNQLSKHMYKVMNKKSMSIYVEFWVECIQN